MYTKPVIYPRLLKETAHNVAPMLTVLYQASLTQHKVPLDWKKALVAPYLRKVIVRLHLITVLFH